MTPCHPTIAEWLAYLARQGKSQLTIATYRRGLTHFAYTLTALAGWVYEKEGQLGATCGATFLDNFSGCVIE